MPREGCRITLEITPEDCFKEGIDYDGSSPEECFYKLWDSINGKPKKDGLDISVAANPYVFVINFEKEG